MKGWRYRYHGLSVHSDICLAEWSSFALPADSDGQVDTSHVSGDDSVVIRRLHPGTEIEPVEGDYRFSAKRAGWFVVRGGREILFSPLPDVAETKLRPYLLGWAWGALIYQRRALVLHASAVRAGSGVVAFCARRGGGKSTLAALLSTSGYPLISDDFCCFRMEPGSHPTLYPSVPRFKLCEDAVEKLDWNTTRPKPEPLHGGKYHYYDDRAVGEPLRDWPLSRIYLLTWGEPEVTRLRGFNALTRLTAAGTWRGDLLMAAGDPAGQFNHYTDLVRQVECWEFRRPRDLRLLAEHAAHLTEHISDLRGRGQ
jgi:hypothetical protein